MVKLDALDVRPLRRADLPAVADVLDRTGLFPSDMLPELAAPFLEGGSDHLWLVANDPSVIGFAYAEPERMTEGTFNLLAIAVVPSRQSQGIGKALVEATLGQLSSRGMRLLLVETSSLGDYAGTRAFYRGLEFTEEARIRDFYQDGEDKIVFWKRTER